MTQYYNTTQYINHNAPIDLDKLMDDLTTKLQWGQEEANVICTAVRNCENALHYCGQTEVCPKQMTLTEYVADTSNVRGLGLDPHNLTIADWPTVTELEDEYRCMCKEFGFEYSVE